MPRSTKAMLEKENLALRRQISMLEKKLIKHDGEIKFRKFFDSITEYRRAEIALRESEQKYSAMFHQAAIPAALVQLPENIFVEINEAAEQMFGFHHWEVIGKNSAEVGLLQPIERNRVYTEFQQGRLLEGGEVRFLKRSGEELIALVKASTVKFNGREYAMITLQDVTENRRAQQKLAYAHEQILELSRRLLDAQEEERRAVARELHDEIGQSLTGLKVLLEIAQRSSSGESREKIQQGQKIAGDLIERVSQLSLDLRPNMLDDFGLLHALLWLVDTFAAHTEINIDFTHTGLQNKRFDSVFEIAVYRIAQASLTNVARHAGVSRAKVMVSANDAYLDLLVEDAGCGFNAQAVFARGEAGGLIGMRERARLLQGDFQIETAPESGTRIIVRLPLRTVAGAKDKL